MTGSDREGNGDREPDDFPRKRKRQSCAVWLYVTATCG